MCGMTALGQAARAASRQLAVLSTARKNAALLAIADALEAQAATVLAANAQDIAAGRAKGLSEALLDRLLLNEKRLAVLAVDTPPRRHAARSGRRGIRRPCTAKRRGGSGRVRLCKRRIPIGVIGVIYEARPNVTIDIATLCLKTGNAAILRGGSETFHSNLALTQVIQDALALSGIAAAAVQTITDPDRALVTELLRLDKYVDMIIPRGGAALHRLCREQATIPVITGGMGICHVFVDESADLARAVDIVENAKVQRPSVCNALDTVLVHRAIAPRIPARDGRAAGAEQGRAARHARRACDPAGRWHASAGRARRPGRFRHRVDGVDPGREDRGLAR